MSTPHTSCRKGKRVLVIMKDGRRIVDKFAERKGNYVVLDSVRLWAGDIRAFTIHRGDRANPTVDPRPTSTGEKQ